MISAGDFRNGVTFEMDGQVVSIIEFQHVKPGKGAAFVRTKIRNVITGAVVEKTFNPNDKYPTAFIDRKDMGAEFGRDALDFSANVSPLGLPEGPISESRLHFCCLEFLV